MLQQRLNSTVIDAVMEIQIKTSVFHLRIEEFIAQGKGVDVEPALAGMDQAIRLAGLVGGRADGKRRAVFAPTPEIGSGQQAQEIKALLADLKAIGLQRIQQAQLSGSAPLSHRQFDMLFNRILAKAAVLEREYEANRVTTRQKSDRLFSGIYLVWGLVVAAATAGLRRMELRRKGAEESLLQANRQLLCQAEELGRHRENLAEMVQKRTTELTLANEQLHVEIDERLQAEATLRASEQQIRHLSSQLLNAQEIERKRISMGLHDGLGQSLYVTKLRVQRIQKRLSKEQQEQRQECESLLDYLDTVIEDVRRLSLELSPAIMEDLGLSAALRWLVSTFARVQGVEVELDIPEIDHLFPEQHQQITIFRVLQEATSNIGRHSQAGKVSIVARHSEDRVTFSVRDDGRGFDPAAAASRSTPEKGLGLATMCERVTMIGGTFDLWSRPGQGTGITFILPVQNGAVS
jgi:signal transduction histidine kinase